MGSILSHQRQARSIADEYFQQTYPGHHLVGYNADACKERLILELEPISDPICPNCSQACPKIHAKLKRTVRCAPRDGFTEVYIDLPVRRVRCLQCGSRRMEHISWLDSHSRLTHKLIAAVQSQTRKGATNTAVAKSLRLDWSTIKRIDKMQLQYVFSEPDFKSVENLIMDEFSLQRGHKYATAIMDADTHRVIWVCKGKSGNDVKAFFELLKEKGADRNIKSVSMDMNACFPSLVAQYLPTAVVLYDGFHILQLFNREVLVEAKKHCQAQALKRYADDASTRSKAVRLLASSQWVLIRKQEDLDPEDIERLRQLRQDNALLSDLYPIADLIRNLWRCKDPDEASRKLNEIVRLCRAISNEHDFKPAMTFANTLKRRRDGIVHVGRFGYSSCPLEGANNKIKVIKRNAYGYRDFEYFKLKIFAALPGVRNEPFRGLTPGRAVLKTGYVSCCFHTNPR